MTAAFVEGGAGRLRRIPPFLARLRGGGAEGAVEPCCARAAMLNAATTVNSMLRDFFI